MKFIWFLCAYNLCLAWKLSVCQNINVEEAFNTNGLIQDVVDVAPINPIKITYQQSNKEVQYGNELTPNEVKEAPTISYDADPSSYYTLTLVDPDAPSRNAPALKLWKHWLVANIPGSNVSGGETLTEYVGSGPPKDSGLHRYVFLLYKQPSKLEFDEYDNAYRPRFDLKKFASDNNLGNPVGGNFFLSQF